MNEKQQLPECPASPNCVSTQATRDSQRMEALFYRGESAQAIEAAAETLKRVVPRIKIVEQTERYLHATATSLVFRFKDDIEFLAIEPSRELHFRSASRLGYSDLGVNRRRMEQVRQHLLELEMFDDSEG